MKLRLLSVEEARKVYEQEMHRDFPPEELKPFAAMERMAADGCYEMLAAEQDGTLCAYAFVTVVPQFGCVLLDYFAVLPQLRGTGVGTAVVQALAEHYRGRKSAMIIECEHPADAPDPVAARRRVGFYLRAGAVASAIESRVYGVHYQIYALDCGAKPGDDAITADLEGIYHYMVPEPYYRANVIFWGR